MTKGWSLILASLAVLLLLGGCVQPAATPTPEPTAEPTVTSTAAPTQAPTPDGAALRITGRPIVPQRWTYEQLSGMEQTEVEVVDEQGQPETWQGVTIHRLLALSGTQDDSEALYLVSDSGATAEVRLLDVMLCDDCIVALVEGERLDVVLPGLSQDEWLSGVVEIQIR